MFLQDGWKHAIVTYVLTHYAQSTITILHKSVLSWLIILNFLNEIFVFDGEKFGPVGEEAFDLNFELICLSLDFELFVAGAFFDDVVDEGFALE